MDWELSTLGDPLADFAYHPMMYRVPPLGIAGLQGSNLRALQVPSEDQYLAAYCESTGRERMPNLIFYLILNLFRLTAIVNGIRGRERRGNAAPITTVPIIVRTPANRESLTMREIQQSLQRYRISEESANRLFAVESKSILQRPV